MTITIAQSESDLLQILELQQLNQNRNVSAEVQQSQGFVTFVYDLAQMQTMVASAPQIIAKDGDKIVGYALTTVPVVGQDIALFKPMFDFLDSSNKCNSSLLQKKAQPDGFLP